VISARPPDRESRVLGRPGRFGVKPIIYPPLSIHPFTRNGLLVPFLPPYRCYPRRGCFTFFSFHGDASQSSFKILLSHPPRSAANFPRFLPPGFLMCCQCGRKGVFRPLPPEGPSLENLKCPVKDFSIKTEVCLIAARSFFPPPPFFFFFRFLSGPCCRKLSFFFLFLGKL